MRAKLLAAPRARASAQASTTRCSPTGTGSTIAALAKAADVFVRVDWLEAAERAFDFVSTRMIKNGRLLHSYRAGEAKAPATATDYANMIKAALALASVTGNPEYIARAREWVDVLDRHYWADDHGGYYLAADDTDDLIVRTINALDDATPNANGTMVSNLMQLYLWTGEERYRDRAEAIVQRLRRRHRQERVLAYRAAHRRASICWRRRISSSWCRKAATRTRSAARSPMCRCRTRWCRR